MTTSELDEHFLRRSFDVARRSMTHGNHPFGAILVDESRNVLIETENGYMPAHDGTGHAERLLATQACTTLGTDVLRNATLYSSAEPCAMCAGAIYWAGIGRVVYLQNAASRTQFSDDSLCALENSSHLITKGFRPQCFRQVTA